MLKKSFVLLLVITVIIHYKAKGQIEKLGFNEFSSVKKIEKLMELGNPAAVRDYLTQHKYKLSAKDQPLVKPTYSYLIDRYMANTKDLMVCIAHKDGVVKMVIEYEYLSGKEDLDVLKLDAQADGYTLTGDNSTTEEQSFDYSKDSYGLSYILKKDLQCSIVLERVK